MCKRKNLLQVNNSFWGTGKFRTGLLFFVLCNPFLLAAQIITDRGWMQDSDKNNDGRGDLKQAREVCRGSLDFRQRDIIFNTGRIVKLLRYRCCADKRHFKKNQSAHTISMNGLGMGDVAWHINGFMDVNIDGASLANYLPEIESKDSGAHGEAIFTWKLPAGNVVFKFSANYGDDYLTLEISLPDSQTKYEKIITFICYPSSLAAGRDRYCLTPERDLQHWKDRSWKKLSPKEFWIMYYDKLWDLGKPGNGKKCKGPCALLYMPPEFSEVAIKITNYAIYTRFKCGKFKKFNFLIWPSMEIPNDKAEEKMKAIKIKSEG